MRILSRVGKMESIIVSQELMIFGLQASLDTEDDRIGTAGVKKLRDALRRSSVHKLDGGRDLVHLENWLLDA